MDKTGLFMILLVLGLLVTAAVVINLADPVTGAIFQAQAGITAAPATLTPAGSLAGFALRALIVLAGVVLLAGLGYLVYHRISIRRHEGGWIPGPNARWQSRSARMPGLMDLMTLQLYRSILGDQEPRAAVLPDERRKARF